jgi:hypothetical protein
VLSEGSAAKLSEKPLAAPTPAERLRGALLGLLAALPWVAVLTGFTVDDALVTARVASHFSQGLGYRFNPGGPVVDAVTPLGFAHLLAAFGAGDSLDMLGRARILGVLGWFGAAALLGAWVAPSLARWRRSVVLVVLSACAPLSAWAWSGMETGVVTLLATLALWPRFGAGFAGVAAALRPELLPWAAVLGVGRALLGGGSPRERVLRVLVGVGLAVAPAVAIAVVRWSWFGTPTPLSAVAKPTGFGDGLRYALGALAFTGPAWLLVSRALARVSAETRLLVAAFGAHVAALVLAGGDWMALYRLMVPALPTALLAAAEIAERGSRVGFWVRGALALAVCGVLGWYKALPARDLLARRVDLIERARPLLAGAERVAGLDVGWLGAASRGTVFDLAGITDPEVARLAGAHTDKKIRSDLWTRRAPDAVVLLLAPGTFSPRAWREAAPARAVEWRVLSLPELESYDFAGVLAVDQGVPPGSTPIPAQNYLFLRRARPLGQ